MNNKKRICVLVFLTMLGTCVISDNRTYADEVSAIAETEAQDVESAEEIKGNREALQKAQDLINQKNFAAAIEYLNAYVSSKPKKYEGYKLRGDSFYALRQYSLAEQDFKKAVELKADDDKFITGTKVFSAVVLGADKYEQMQNPELGNLYGRLMYSQMAQNNPAYEVAYDNAVKYNSHIYLPKPKAQEITAINCPQKYGKLLNPQGGDVYIYGAINDIENGNYIDAIFKSQNVISEYPNYYLGYYLNGVARAGMDQEKEAIEAFNNALKNNPYDFESLASIGQIYYQKAEKTFSSKDAEKSIDYFQQALKYNPNSNLYNFYVGLNQLQIGDAQSALGSFNRAIKLKSNDYNSLYYKLIAQYLLSDYRSVVDGATVLLYKRVSNYNSVLYLRALAYYKQGSYDLALEDLETIQRSVNDIYNADIRVQSEKEKTLDSYIYYLKAQIVQANGGGAKSDLQHAYENPVIAKLSSLGNKNAHTEVIMPDSAFENQYDYIRTTFADLGLNISYMYPDYKLSVSSNFVAERTVDVTGEPTTLLPKEDRKIMSVEQALEMTKDSKANLVKEDETSIAQALAFNSLYSSSQQNSNVTVEEVVSSSDLPVLRAAEKIIDSAEDKVVEEVKQNVADTVKEVIPEEVIELGSGNLLYTAANQMPSQSFNISYPKQITDNFSSASESKSVKFIEEIISEQDIPALKSADEIVEQLIPEVMEDENVTSAQPVAQIEEVVANITPETVKEPEFVPEEPQLDEDGRIVLPDDERLLVKDEVVEVPIVKVPELRPEAIQDSVNVSDTIEVVDEAVSAVEQISEEIEGTAVDVADTADSLIETVAETPVKLTKQEIAEAKAIAKEEKRIANEQARRAAEEARNAVIAERLAAQEERRLEKEAFKQAKSEAKADTKALKAELKEEKRLAKETAKAEAEKAKAALKAEKEAAKEVKRAAKSASKNKIDDIFANDNEVPVLRPEAIIEEVRERDTVNFYDYGEDKSFGGKTRKQEIEQKVNSFDVSTFTNPVEENSVERSSENVTDNIEQKAEKKVKQKKEKKVKEVIQKIEEPVIPTQDELDNAIKPISVKQTTKKYPQPLEVVNHDGVERKVIKRIDR